MRWVVGNEVYGQSTALRDEVADHGCWYLLTVRTTTKVWTEPPASPYGRGDPTHANVQLAQAVGGAISVAIAIDEWPESRWKRLTVAEGEKAPRTYDWACRRVWESHDSLPGRESWLLARRSLSDTAKIAYYLSNTPEDTPLLTLAQVASRRYTMEQCIKEAKQETRLDEYAVGYWHS